MKKLQFLFYFLFLIFVFSVAPAYPQENSSRQVDEGFELLRNQNFAAAVNKFAVILGQEPDNTKARLGLAIALIGVEKYPEASREIAKLLARSPRDPKLLEMAAQTFWQQKRFVEAEKVLKRRLDLGDGRAELWALYGDALDAQKKTVEAIPAYENAVRLSPDSLDYRYALGSLYWKSIRYSDAERELLEVLKRDPKEPRASFNLGDIYLTKGEPARALPYLETAARAFPDEFDTRLGYGKALLALSRFAEAVAELEAAVGLKPEIAEGHFQLGLALQRSGQREQAAAAFRKARDLQNAKRAAEGIKPQ